MCLLHIIIRCYCLGLTEMSPATVTMNMMAPANVTATALNMATSFAFSRFPHTHWASSYHYMVQADVVDLRQVVRIGLQHGDPLGVDDSVYFAIGVI